MTQNITDDELNSADEQYREEEADNQAQYMAQAEAADAATGSRLSWLWRSTIVRIVIIAVFVFIVAVVVGSLIYSSTRAQRGQQLSVDIFPGASLVGKRTTPNSDTQTYATTASFQTVYDFYLQHITASDGSGCQKVYTGKAVSEAPGQVAGKCFILNAFQDANQFLSVSIQTQLTPDGKPDKTLIVIDRSWKG